jgi:hypothetical protein
LVQKAGLCGHRKQLSWKMAKYPKYKRKFVENDKKGLKKPVFPLDFCAILLYNQINLKIGGEGAWVN